VNINGVLAAVENARFARFCSDCDAAVGVVLDGEPALLDDGAGTCLADDFVKHRDVFCG
jgi:hypothetical protein